MKYNLRVMANTDIDSVNKLLQQLSVYEPEPLILQKSLAHMFNMGVYPCVLELPLFGVIGVGFLYFYPKIRGGLVAHIEDISVNPLFHHRGFGSLIINHLIEKACDRSCYLITLECKQKNVAFYEKFGFYRAGYSLTKRIV